MFQLTHMMTWTTISPVLALSYFSRLYPPHPLTQQFAVRVLRSYSSVSIRKFPPTIRIPCFFPWPSCLPPSPPPTTTTPTTKKRTHLTGCTDRMCLFQDVSQFYFSSVFFRMRRCYRPPLCIYFLCVAVVPPASPWISVCVFVRMYRCYAPPPPPPPNRFLCFARMCCCYPPPPPIFVFCQDVLIHTHHDYFLGFFVCVFSGCAAVLHTLIILCFFFRMCCCSTHYTPWLFSVFFQDMLLFYTP